MSKIVAQFEVPFYQVLNDESVLVDDLPPFAQDVEHLIALYRTMVLIRTFDAKAIALQRTGQLGTYPSIRGQEAVFTGIGDAMAKNDIFAPYYRDYATMILRGVKLAEILQYWGGDERGNCFSCGGDDFPFSVPVGSQGLYAAGAATAIQLRGEKRAVVATCGDGATSQGDFYEALNVAGIWKLPVVFVVNNNQWAISVPRSAQTAAKTLAQKAIAAGFSGEQVDGNDILAVRERTFLALERARAQQGPTLLEMVCYRQSDHTTADEASRYETKGVRETEWKKEPVTRLQNYLAKHHHWSEEQEQKLQADCIAEVEQAVQDYLALKPDTAAAMFDYLYAELPAAYHAQRDHVKMREEHAHG